MLFLILYSKIDLLATQNQLQKNRWNDKSRKKKSLNKNKPYDFLLPYIKKK
jgi:hypothetical protein